MNLLGQKIMEACEISRSILMPLCKPFSCTLWKRTDAIRTGGSLCVQCADVHSVWALYTNVSLMEQFGK